MELREKSPRFGALTLIAPNHPLRQGAARSSTPPMWSRLHGKRTF